MMFDLFDLASASDPTPSSEDSPAKTFPWLESVLALTASGAASGTSSGESSASFFPSTYLSRMSLACFPPMEGGTLPSSFPGWANSGMGGPTGFSTLNSTECHNGGGVCSLSDVLEDARTVPPKYFLSPTACRGILRRAAKRGRELPTQLRLALEAVSSAAEETDKTTS